MGKGEADHVPWRALLAPGYATSLALVCMGVWLHAADELIIATMMPTIVAEIGGAGLIAWAFTLYELGSVIAGAVSALLAIRYGVRLPMVASAMTFAIGCALAALAPVMQVLLVGRLLQGLGGGGLVALAFIAVTIFFPLHLTARAMAAMSALWGASAFLGPLIGGVFVEIGWWRGGFWFFGAQAALLTIWIATRSGADRAGDLPEGRAGVPALRLALLASGVVLIAFASTDVPAFQMAALVLAGLVSLSAFLWLDRHCGERRLLPRVPISLTDPVGAALLMVFAMSAASISLTVYGPLLMTYLHGVSALTAGYVIACSSISWTVAAILVSGAPERRDRLFILIGMLIVAASVAGLIYAIPNGPVWLIAFCATMEGGGFGMAWTFVLRRARRLAERGEIERVSGAIPTVQRVGYAIGAALIGIIANAAGLAAEPGPEVARTVGIWVFVACLPLAGVALVAALRFVSAAVEPPDAKPAAPPH